MAFLLFLSAVWQFWEEGKETVKGLLFSGDISVTAAAVDHFAQQLGNGECVKDAFVGFCETILEGA